MNQAATMTGRTVLGGIAVMSVYLRALGAAGALLTVPVMEVMVANRLHVGLILNCVAGAGRILWCAQTGPVDASTDLSLTSSPAPGADARPAHSC